MEAVTAGADEAARPTVLVVGAGGFIGGYLVAALRRHGCNVLRGVRHASASDERACDLQRMQDRDAWLPALQGVDAVVNAAGILRETDGQDFHSVHEQGPLGLARACVSAGVRRFVQVSALGEPADGGFIASKHRFDTALQTLPLSAVVLRPSVVYAAGGSYGGTSLLRALAGLPGLQLLPGDGRWQLQPVSAEDLGELVARTVVSEVEGVFEVGGPEVMTLADYQRSWRQWLRLPVRRAWHVPEALVSPAVAVMERLGRGPFGATMWRMLRRGNVIEPDAGERLHAAFGLRMRSLREVLASQPSQAQDRWQAQLYFLAPALRIAIAVVWLLSAVVGLITPAQTIEQMASGSWLASAMPVALACAGAVADLLLGAWLLTGWRPRMAVAASLVLVTAYTLAFGIVLPALWLDPLGGLAKNLVLLPALAVLWVLSERR